MPDSTMIRRRLAISRLVLVASREYLDQKGRPTSSEDLINHSMIGARPELVLNMHGPKGKVTSTFKSRVAANDPKTITSIVSESGGIALLPWFLVGSALSSGALEIVLPAFKHDDVDLSPINSASCSHSG
jgi:DNA-binding transcriptional LysR family regulator